MKNNAEFMWLTLDKLPKEERVTGTMTAAWPFPTGAKPTMTVKPKTSTVKPWPFPKSVDIDVTGPEAQVANAPLFDFRTQMKVSRPGFDVDPSYDQPSRLFDLKSGQIKLKTETDPNGKAPNEPGAKVDAGKIRIWLCVAGFSRALEEVARVTTIGATKYTPNGWAQVPNGSERYMDAFGRHLVSAGKGEIVDDGPNGTGCLHKAQMIWNLLASLELDLRKEENERN